MLMSDGHPSCRRAKRSMWIICRKRKPGWTAQSAIVYRIGNECIRYLRSAQANGDIFVAVSLSICLVWRFGGLGILLSILVF